jgi:hypothetical protein
MKIIEENEDLILDVIQNCVNSIKEKILDENYFSSKEFTEIIRNMISLSKNKNQINESLQSKSVNNEFIEMLKEKINTEIDGNPALFEEFSRLLARISIAGKN